VIIPLAFDTTRSPLGLVATACARPRCFAEEKLKRLYRLVEDGLTDLDEVLKDRLSALKADRDRAQAALERAREHLAPQIQIDLRFLALRKTTGLKIPGVLIPRRVFTQPDGLPCDCVGITTGVPQIAADLLTAYGDPDERGEPAP
jgi:hypothetical protein